MICHLIEAQRTWSLGVEDFYQKSIGMEPDLAWRGVGRGARWWKIHKDLMEGLHLWSFRNMDEALDQWEDKFPGSKFLPRH